MKRKVILMVLGVLIVSGYSSEGMGKMKKGIPHVAPKESAKGTPGKREEGDFVVEKRSDGSTVKYKKKTTYDFEGANIEGLYNKPSGSYISNIKDVKGKSIIRIRENFDSEVIDSSRLIK
ncbi:MAG: hypothetical protein ACKOA8_07655 [Deltaproteobacteria bacterium]|jgi:hypothetical protein